MNRLKVYLDTSVISFRKICQKMADTAASIAQQIIDLGILTKKSYDDCQLSRRPLPTNVAASYHEILSTL